jgi:MoaA/NifB/PqqE/SkfB family radical SAM enzyme
MAAEIVELPRYVQLEPVGQCNLRCTMCPIQYREDGPPFGPPAFMAWETFERLIDGFDTMTELHLQGLGEPMMHPRFFDMIEYAARRGIRVSTNTNISLLNQRRADRCVSSGLDCIHVSIDGATAETYERIRIRGHWDRVLRNMERLIESRQRLGGDLPRIRLVMVIMRQNLAELPDLVRLAHGWQVEGMFVQHLCHDFGEQSLPAHYRPMREYVEAQTLLNEDPVRIERYFQLARANAETLGVDLRLPRTRPKPHPASTSGRSRCDWPWTGGYVSYQGLAMPCCMVSTPDRVNFGNMAERGVRAVWGGEEFEAFRRRLDSDDPPEICRSCSLYHGTF